MNEKLELLKKFGECRCVVGGQNLYINFEERKINNVVLPEEEFDRFVNNNAEEITKDPQIIKWITSEDYCELHNISRAALSKRVSTGKVLTKKINKNISLYEK